MQPIRITFMHGLESRPNGTKTQMLRAQGFEVHAADMHMSLMDLRRRNSVVRMLLRSPELWAMLLTLALGGVLGGLLQRGWVALVSVGVVGLWATLRWRALAATAIGRSFDACVEIQIEAVRVASPDLVVGSSWGGAVAAEVLARGAWSGPTILLAPALARVRVWARREGGEATQRALELRGAAAPIVVFHDPSDDVIPHDDSVELTRGVLELRTVSAGGHRLLGLLESGTLGATIEALMSEAAS